ncbi:DUF262 domain-containing protein [Achromobacter xylosoxidans]
MQSQLKSLSKLFSETIFRISDYQRGYSWEERHLKDFWNDIEQLPAGKNHYTGVLTLEPVLAQDWKSWSDDLWIIESRQYQPLYIVDGQQRLTTAIILLHEILSSISDDESLNYFTKNEIRKKYIFESRDGGISRSYVFGYEKDNPSAEYLKEVVFEEASENHSVLEATSYTKNLGIAKAFFGRKIEKLSIEQKERLFAKLTQNFQFNVFYIEPDLDVFVAFETMNNRGKPLSHLELLKNRLIYLSTKFDADKHERERLRKAINESWKTVYHYLGKMASRKFTDDVFLWAHFLCYFGPKLVGKSEQQEEDNRRYLQRRWGGEAFKEKLLDDIFTPKHLTSDDPEKRLTIDGVFGFSQHIKQTVKVYHDVAVPDASRWSDQEKMLLSSIVRISELAIFALSIAVMHSINEVERRIPLLKAMERFGFLRRFSSYYFSSIDVERLTIELLAQELEPEDIIRTLQAMSDKFVRSPEFVEALKSIGKNNGYYAWGPLRYFMYEYEQHLRTLSKTQRQLLTWGDYVRESFEIDHKTVEHIYPQRAVDPYWKQKFTQYSVAERNTLRNSLGNLLPVSHPKNSSLGNKSFLIKKGGVSAQAGYRYGCLSEIQVSHEEDWGATEILKRGVRLLEFMSMRWDIPLGDAQNKVKILGLEFVTPREGVSLDTLLADKLKLPTPKEIAAAQDPEPIEPTYDEDEMEM